MPSSGDEWVKQYLFDPGDGSPVGGNLVVQVRFQNVVRATVGGRPVFSNFQKNTPLNHAFATAQGTPVMFCRVRQDYKPKYTLKITLTHTQRGDIAVMTGFAGSFP